MLIQARSRHKLQELLDVADWWEGIKDSNCSVPKFVYLTETEVGGEHVRQTGQDVKRATAETCLGVTITSGGTSMQKSEHMVRGVALELTTLTKVKAANNDTALARVGLSLYFIGEG